MSFPQVTEMFQFTWFASCNYGFIAGYLAVGFPIRKFPGQMLICQLTGTYRRLSRPSSPIIAKASTTCS